MCVPAKFTHNHLFYIATLQRCSHCGDCCRTEDHQAGLDWALKTVHHPHLYTLLLQLWLQAPLGGASPWLLHHCYPILQGVCGSVYTGFMISFINESMNVEVSQLLLWTWNNERLSFLTTYQVPYQVKLSRKRTLHHLMSSCPIQLMLIPLTSHVNSDSTHTSSSVSRPPAEDVLHLHLHCSVADVMELGCTHPHPAPADPTHTSHLPPDAHRSHRWGTHEPSLCQHHVLPLLRQTGQVLGEELQVSGYFVCVCVSTPVCVCRGGVMSVSLCNTVHLVLCKMMCIGKVIYDFQAVFHTGGGVLWDFPS